ncbi:glutaredoxin-1-like [Brevipalpus obovatus]|uniref:glutaredoxin-1-like n=1 Tax=Brevipalpus obovatus TaxID=246614 RepID=UPI003D9F768F
MGGILNRISGPVVMDESVKLFVDEAISKHKVCVFSKTYCPYCKKAKEIISKYKIKDGQLDWIEVEKRPDCAQIQAYLKELTGASSVPRVFVDGKCIGGCDDTTAADSSGKLMTLLTECGALE